MFIGRFINTVIAFIIWSIRPLLGPSNCRYPVGCTEYAYQQLSTQPTFKALWLIIKRVGSCAPFMPMRLMSFSFFYVSFLCDAFSLMV